MASPIEGDTEANDPWKVFGSFAKKAKSAAAQITPQLQNIVGTRTDDLPDAETGEDASSGWTSWAKEAAERVKSHATEAAGQAQLNLSQGIEIAKNVSGDWGEKAKGVRTNISSGLDRVTDGATSATSSFHEKVTQGVESLKYIDLSDQAKSLPRQFSRGFESLAHSASSAGASVQGKLGESQVVQKAREKSTAAAGAARGALSIASDRVSSVATLATSPMKLMQFAAVFMVGVFLIMLSCNFLPILLIAPQKFALLFTCGSMVMLSSFAVLTGPQAFAIQLAQKDKLTFSGAYGVSLIGTLWATLFMRSYILTTLFAIVQAFALLYFLASYVPGGTTCLNAMGRLGRRSVRTVIPSSG